MVSTRDEDSDYFRLKGSSRRRKMIGSQRVDILRLTHISANQALPHQTTE